jgi:hypothetical protein
MDEIEIKLALKAAGNALEKVYDPDTKQCLDQVVNILYALNDRITELQAEVDDC